MSRLFLFGGVGLQLPIGGAAIPCPSEEGDYGAGKHKYFLIGNPQGAGPLTHGYG